MVNMLKEIDFKPVKPVGCCFHSIEAHNFHIRRYGFCLYCKQGSVAVPKCIVEEESG